MIVLVTGANGFVGSVICRELLRRGHVVHALARADSNRELIPIAATTALGDLASTDDMRRVLAESSPEAIVHAASVVSIGRPNLDASMRVNVSATAALIDLARARDVRRWIQISSMSAHPRNRSVYGGSKYIQERLAALHAPGATILRPSLVYGHLRRGIFHQLVQLLDRLPVVPLIGMGREPMRPVHVEDLAIAAGNALATDAAIGGLYEIGGPEDWTFRDLVLAIRRQLGRNGVTIPLPLPICRVMALVGEACLSRPPFTTDNIEGIATARTLDPVPAARDLAHIPRSFAEGFADCLERGLLDGPPAR